MSDVRRLTCIRCPRGCQLEAVVEGGSVASVTGTACPRGAAYAADEVCHPMRCVTTTVAVSLSKDGDGNWSVNGTPDFFSALYGGSDVINGLAPQAE